MTKSPDFVTTHEIRTPLRSWKVSVVLSAGAGVADEAERQAFANPFAGDTAGLLIITAGWTGCRWGELTGLLRDNIDLGRGTLTIDPRTGALHEGAHTRWLGSPKTPSSARTITLPPFLITMLRKHLERHDHEFVFTDEGGTWLWRSTFISRVLKPAVNGNEGHPQAGIRTVPIRPGLTFHGLLHSHKTWLIADGAPEIAQARRLGHHLPNRVTDVYSHVAPEVELRLLNDLQRRWHEGRPECPSAPERAGARRTPCFGSACVVSNPLPLTPLVGGARRSPRPATSTTIQPENPAPEVLHRVTAKRSTSDHSRSTQNSKKPA
ncbi:site-specific integrase [Lentzea terrae]|uniref:site-specific integrase n=1 Tax=Lentzea terrae TaxID=2200761 RepID=UPI00130097C2|nr:site-specific integrase [Lentzea terrae]